MRTPAQNWALSRLYFQSEAPLLTSSSSYCRAHSAGCDSAVKMLMVVRTAASRPSQLAALSVLDFRRLGVQACNVLPPNAGNERLPPVFVHNSAALQAWLRRQLLLSPPANPPPGTVCRQLRARDWRAPPQSLSAHTATDDFSRR